MNEKKISVKNLYFIFVICAGLIVLGIGSTYAVFTAEVELISPIALSSNLSSENNLIETISIDVPAGETITSTITVTNDSDEPINYVVFYVDEGYELFFNSINGSSVGSLDAYSDDSVNFAIYNNEVESVTVVVGVVSNTKSISLGENMKQIPNIEGESLVKIISDLYKNNEKSIVTINDVEYNHAQEVSLLNDRMLGGITSEPTTDYDAGNIRYYGLTPNNYIDIGDVYTEDTVVNYYEKNSTNFMLLVNSVDSSESCYEYFQTQNDCSEAEDAAACESELKLMLRLYFGVDSVDEVCGIVTKPAGTPKLYRIVGLFKNINLSDGTTKNLIKVVRDESLGVFAWGMNLEEETLATDWSDSSLKDILNSNYYYSSGAIEHSYFDVWGSSSEPITLTTDFSQSGLNDSVHNKIANVVWNMERLDSISTTWNGNITIPNYSDFILSQDKVLCDSENSDSTETMDSNTCAMYSTWLDNGMYVWYGSYYVSDSMLYAVMFSIYDFLINDSVIAAKEPAYGGFVSPAFYLNSNVVVVSGDGSKENPYVLK